MAVCGICEKDRPCFNCESHGTDDSLCPAPICETCHRGEGEVANIGNLMERTFAALDFMGSPLMLAFAASARKRPDWREVPPTPSDMPKVPVEVYERDLFPEDIARREEEDERTLQEREENI